MFTQDTEPSDGPPPVESIIKDVCQQYAISKHDLLKSGATRKASQARALVALVAINSKSATLTDIATRLNRDIATLSTGAKKLVMKIQNSGDNSGLWSEVLKHFNIKT